MAPTRVRGTSLLPACVPRLPLPLPLPRLSAQTCVCVRL
jgi:hypothetical protein